MDDNNITTLTEAQYEWALRLVNILSPLIQEGVQSIFSESWNICKKENELDKYLMTFQNLLSRVPKWNEDIIQTEVDRIVEKSGCSYLEDLLSCVHIIHLKILTTIRTGKTQKKIEIDIPKLNHFIHKIYVNSSRCLYTRVYLFEKDIPPLVVQRNRAEFNELVKQSIMNVVRDSIPVEFLLRAYLDESTDLIGTVKESDVVKKEESKEDNVIEQKKAELKALLKENDAEGENKSEEKKTDEENKTDEVKKTEPTITMSIGTDSPEVSKPTDENAKLSFSNTDNAIGTDKKEEIVPAPKDISTLEKISSERHAQRKTEEAEDGDEKLTIHSGPDIVLSNADVQDISIPAPVVNEAPLILTDVEVLV